VEAESIQLVLDLVLRLVAAGGGVLLEVAKRVREGMLLCLGSLAELLLACLLI
jgi:hypothetical protein